MDDELTEHSRSLVGQSSVPEDKSSQIGELVYGEVRCE